jgi:hypothetical protein
MNIKDIYIDEYVQEQAKLFRDKLIQLIDNNIQNYANALSGKIRMSLSTSEGWLKEIKLVELFNNNIALRKYINIGIKALSIISVLFLSKY